MKKKELLREFELLIEGQPKFKRNLQADEQIKALIENEPTVTEEWIEEQAVFTANDYSDVAFPNLIAIFKKLLKEAGVSVA